MLDTPHITQTTAQITAIIHLTIPRAEMQKVFGPCIGELMAAIASQGSEPVGSVFTHHLKIVPDIFDFELSVRVSAPVVAAGRVKPSQWPAMKVARTVYHGPYEGLPAAWREFMGRRLARCGRKRNIPLCLSQLWAWEGRLRASFGQARAIARGTQSQGTCPGVRNGFPLVIRHTLSSRSGSAQARTLLKPR